MGAARFGSTFYVRMGLAMLLLVLLGFLPAINMRLSTGGTASFFLASHGVLFFIWIGAFITQAHLAGSGNLRLHRRLGSMSPVLAGLMVLSCIFLTVETFHTYKDNVPGLTREHFIILPMMDGTLFTVYYTLAFLKRRQAETHKHLMLLASVMIMNPAVARFGGFLGSPLIGIVLHFALLFAIVIHDRRTLGRIHIATAIAVPLLVAYYLGLFFVGPTPGWAVFVTWLFG